MQMPEPIKSPELITKLRHDKVNAWRERVDSAGMGICDRFLDFTVLLQLYGKKRSEGVVSPIYDSNPGSVEFSWKISISTY